MRVYIINIRRKFQKVIKINQGYTSIYPTQIKHIKIKVELVAF